MLEKNKTENAEKRSKVLRHRIQIGVREISYPGHEDH